MGEPYTIISADCHAGGGHEQYRECLDPAEPDEALPRAARQLATVSS